MEFQALVWCLLIVTAYRNVGELEASGLTAPATGSSVILARAYYVFNFSKLHLSGGRFSLGMSNSKWHRKYHNYGYPHPKDAPIICKEGKLLRYKKNLLVSLTSHNLEPSLQGTVLFFVCFLWLLDTFNPPKALEGNLYYSSTSSWLIIFKFYQDGSIIWGHP